MADSISSRTARTQSPRFTHCRHGCHARWVRCALSDGMRGCVGYQMQGAWGVLRLKLEDATRKGAAVEIARVSDMWNEQTHQRTDNKHGSLSCSEEPVPSPGGDEESASVDMDRVYVDRIPDETVGVLVITALMEQVKKAWSERPPGEQCAFWWCPDPYVSDDHLDAALGQLIESGWRIELDEAYNVPIDKIALYDRPDGIKRWWGKPYIVVAPLCGELGTQTQAPKKSRTPSSGRCLRFFLATQWLWGCGLCLVIILIIILPIALTK